MFVINFSETKIYSLFNQNRNFCVYSTMLPLIIFFGYIFSIISANYDENIVKTALNISQASYCMSELDKWTCTTCVDSNIYETKLIEENELVIIGYNSPYNAIFVGFRGSSNIQNWLDNLQVQLVKPYNDTQIEVEHGFYKIYSALDQKIYTIIDNLRLKYDTNNILVTGHSLGGAIATLFAFDVCYYNVPYKIYSLITFGSPRVGNNYFSEYVSMCDFASFRVTHHYDIVPHVPEEFLGYEHISQEVWYNEPNADYVLCNDSDEEDSACSNSCAPLKCTSIHDHMNYLNISMGNDGLC